MDKGYLLRSEDASQGAEESGQGMMTCTCALQKTRSRRSVSNGVKGQWATGRQFGP
jgi:hypothetical protein